MPRKLALLIGVSEYGAGIPDLSAPVFDLEAMKRVLENEAMGGFESVKTLLNPDPTAMRLGVQQIFAGCSRDDLVLLFFSGHGITDDNNRLYFATKGTSQDYYKATSVAASFIQDVSLDSYAKRQVIVLDCCYSGAFAEGWQSKSVGLNLQQQLGAEGRVVLTSSSATQKSFQQTGQELSLYTKYFVEGIETGAAGNREQGKIYAFELHEYAKAKVQEVKPKQQPAIIIDREGYNILLSQAPINDPELEFRRRVEKYAAKGSISNIRRRTLEILRQGLDIPEEKSQVIINEVLASYRQHQHLQHLQNIELYRQVFTETVEQHYHLTTETLSELQDLQDELGLEEQDVAAIKAEILAAKDAESQQLNSPQDLPKNRITNPELVSPKEKPNFLSKLFSPLVQMTAEDYFNRAVDKQKKGDYRGAIADLDHTIQLQPDFSYAYNNRGSAYDDLGEYKKAIADYEQAIQLQPDFALAYNNRGSAYKKLGEYQKAIADYEQAIQLQPDYVKAYNNRGFAYNSLGEYKKAIADYDQVIKIQPDYTDAYINRGFAYNNLKEYKKAIADYDQAIQLQPDYTDAYINRGFAYRNLGEYKKAIADYDQAIQLQPDYTDAYINRGFAYNNLEEYEKALFDCDQAIQLQPDFALACNNRGNAYYGLGEYEKAIADYNQAIQLQPDFAIAYNNRGNAYNNLEEYEKALFAIVRTILVEEKKKATH